MSFLRVWVSGSSKSEREGLQRLKITHQMENNNPWSTGLMIVLYQKKDDFRMRQTE
jgi:hypothetical protein